MARIEAPATVMVRGIVVPTEWDRNGAVRRVAILTADEGEYEVLADPTGDRLIPLLQEEVEVSGVVHGGADRASVLAVLSIRVLDMADLGGDGDSAVHSSGPLTD
jgi:hypothetical protein